MKGFKKLLIIFAIFLIASAPVASAAPVVVDGHPTNVQCTICNEQGHGKQNPVNIGGYDLVGPVVSGDVIVTDVGNLETGRATLTDLITVNKEVTEVAAGYQVDLTIEARAAQLSYNPPPQLEVIIVYDVTTSMTRPITRLHNAQAAIKHAAADIWAENPNSAITIIPYARDVYTPLPAGGLSFNNSTMYTAGYPSSLGYPTGTDPINHTNTTYAEILTAQSSLVAGIGTIFGNDPDYQYYRVTKADVDAMTNGMDTFNDSIDAIPMAKDTNTHSGLMKAHEFLIDPTFTTIDEQKNRVVILITDGNAGRYIDSSGAVDSAVQYTRTSVLTSHEKALEKADKIKDENDGNAILYALGLEVEYTWFQTTAAGPNGEGWGGYLSTPPAGTEILPGTPSAVYQLETGVTYIDVPKYLSTLPTSLDHYYNVDSTMIEEMMAQAVASSTHYYAPIGSLTVKDAINSALFEYAPSTDIEISVDGATAVLLSTYDPTATLGTDSFSINLEENPTGTPLTSLSKTEYVISYTIQAIDPTLEGGHLHIGNDYKSYVSYIAPEHHAQPTEPVYRHVARNTYYVPFNTPTVQRGFYIIKEVSADGLTWSNHLILPEGGGTVDYKITIGNKGASSVYIDRVTDLLGGTNPELIYADKTNNNLIDPASGATWDTAFDTILTTTPTEFQTGDEYEIEYTLTHTELGTYRNMVAIKGFGTSIADFDNDPGQLRSATATVAVQRESTGGGSGTGGAVVSPGNNVATPPNQGNDQPSGTDQPSETGSANTFEEDEKPVIVEETKDGIPTTYWIIGLILVLLAATAIYIIWKKSKKEES